MLKRATSLGTEKVDTRIHPPLDYRYICLIKSLSCKSKREISSRCYICQCSYSLTLVVSSLLQVTWNDNRGLAHIFRNIPWLFPVFKGLNPQKKQTARSQYFLWICRVVEIDAGTLLGEWSQTPFLRKKEVFN